MAVRGAEEGDGIGERVVVGVVGVVVVLRTQGGDFTEHDGSFS